MKVQRDYTFFLKLNTFFFVFSYHTNMCTFFLLFLKLTCLNNIRCVSRFKKKKKKKQLTLLRIYYISLKKRTRKLHFQV